jgi:hypothetical protein
MGRGEPIAADKIGSRESAYKLQKLHLGRLEQGLRITYSHPTPRIGLRSEAIDTWQELYLQLLL